MKRYAIAFAVALSGCASEPKAPIDPPRLSPPADHLMVPPRQLPPTPECFDGTIEGKPAVTSKQVHEVKTCKAAHLTDLRLAYGDEASKVTGLQAYVRTVRGRH